MPDDDRDALSWDGDADDDTLVTRDPEASAPAAAATATVAAEARADASGDRAAKVVSALFLLIAVAWAIGWVVVAFSNGTTSGIDLLALALYQLGEVLAMITPVIWWLLARRLAPNPVPWWIAGAVVTAPWPLVVGMLA